jgi:hypothetical protein
MYSIPVDPLRNANLFPFRSSNVWITLKQTIRKMCASLMPHLFTAPLLPATTSRQNPKKRSSRPLPPSTLYNDLEVIECLT